MTNDKYQNIINLATSSNLIGERIKPQIGTIADQVQQLDNILSDSSSPYTQDIVDSIAAREAPMSTQSLLQSLIENAESLKFSENEMDRKVYEFLKERASEEHLEEELEDQEATAENIRHKIDANKNNGLMMRYLMGFYAGIAKALDPEKGTIHIHVEPEVKPDHQDYEMHGNSITINVPAWVIIRDTIVTPPTEDGTASLPRDKVAENYKKAAIEKGIRSGYGLMREKIDSKLPALDPMSLAKELTRCIDKELGSQGRA